MLLDDMMLLERVEEAFNMSAYYDTDLKQQFFEFNLADFDLPSAEQLLEITLDVQQQLGRLQGWKSNGTESAIYKGFSLTYNPVNGIDPYATWGDLRLGREPFSTMKDSYHDTYAFNTIHPLMAKAYEPLLSRLNCQVTRSRVAYIDPVNEQVTYMNFHKDEFPYQNLRINIPLQTDPDYVLEINGTDEYGNSLQLTQHLEVGKFYIWNTRIPHRVYAKQVPKSKVPRIHIVLGVMPWIDIIGDVFSKNQFFGTQPFAMIEKGRLFK